MGRGVVIAGDEGCVKDAIKAMRNAFSPNMRAREIVWIFLFKYGFCSNFAMFGFLNSAHRRQVTFLLSFEISALSNSNEVDRKGIWILKLGFVISVYRY